LTGFAKVPSFLAVGYVIALQISVTQFPGDSVLSVALEQPLSPPEKSAQPSLSLSIWSLHSGVTQLTEGSEHDLSARKSPGMLL